MILFSSFILLSTIDWRQRWSLWQDYMSAT